MVNDACAVLANSFLTAPTSVQTTELICAMGDADHVSVDE